VLEGDAVGRATRGAARSFTAHEVDRILAVGVCLPCHEKADDPIYQDFPAAHTTWRDGNARGCGLPTSPGR
jgi:hypothetical protein